MKHFIVPEIKTGNPVIVGTSGFIPPDVICDAPIDETGRPFPIEAITVEDEILTGPDGKEIVDLETGIILTRKVAKVNPDLLKTYKDQLTAAKSAEQTRLTQRQELRAKLKGLNWAEVTTVAQLKVVLKDILQELLHD